MLVFVDLSIVFDLFVLSGYERVHCFQRRRNRIIAQPRFARKSISPHRNFYFFIIFHLVPLWSQVVFMYHLASFHPKIVISPTNLTFSTKFQPVSSQLTHACTFHLAFFPWTNGPCSLSLDHRYTVVAELGWISACFYSWLLEESRSIPVRHHHSTSLSVCWILDQWSTRHHYFIA